MSSINSYNSESTPYLWTMLFGLLLTFLLANSINLFIKNKAEKRANIAIKAVYKYGNELEKIFTVCALNSWTIQVTLKNNKVYVGFIDQIPLPDSTNYFELMPLKSGYRDSETKELHLITEYSTIHDLLVFEKKEEEISKMVVVIKQDEVLTASPHDDEVYQRFMDTPPSSRWHPLVELPTFLPIGIGIRLASQFLLFTSNFLHPYLHPLTA